MIRGEGYYKVPEIVIDMSLSSSSMGFKNGYSFAIDTLSVKSGCLTGVIGGTYYIKSRKF